MTPKDKNELRKVAEELHVPYNMDKLHIRIAMVLAIEKGYIKKEGDIFYRWVYVQPGEDAQKKPNSTALAFFLSLLICGDIYQPSEPNVIKEVNASSIFPEITLNTLFCTKQLSQTRKSLFTKKRVKQWMEDINKLCEDAKTLAAELNETPLQDGGKPVPLIQKYMQLMDSVYNMHNNFDDKETIYDVVEQYIRTNFEDPNIIKDIQKVVIPYWGRLHGRYGTHDRLMRVLIDIEKAAHYRLQVNFTVFDFENPEER